MGVLGETYRRFTRLDPSERYRSSFQGKLDHLVRSSSGTIRLETKFKDIITHVGKSSEGCSICLEELADGEEVFAH